MISTLCKLSRTSLASASKVLVPKYTCNLVPVLSAISLESPLALSHSHSQYSSPTHSHVQMSSFHSSASSFKGSADFFVPPACSAAASSKKKKPSADPLDDERIAFSVLASATAPAPAVAAKKEGVEPGGGPLDISLKDELLFIKSLLIPAFDPDNSEPETSKERKEWMKKRANNTNWDAGVSAELIKRYGTVNSLEEAKKERTKAERLLEKAEEKAERSLEKARENEIGRGKSSIICSFIIFMSIVILYDLM